MEQTQSNLSLKKILSKVMITKVPGYANRIYYSLGFLAISMLVMLTITGFVMVFEGPVWWLTSPVGVFFRSVHLWSAQALILLIIVHVIVVFSTSAFKPPRRLTWVLGSLLLFLVLFEAEFGYSIRADFSSQYRVLQASDFYNGIGLGAFINNLNYAQIYGIHIILIPITIFAILGLHYLLVKARGIATPFRKDFQYQMVPANHIALFIRAGVLVCVIIFLAIVAPSPLILPDTITSIANDDPGLVAQTILSEWNHSSDTATYLDTIDPYTFDTKSVYVDVPYQQYFSIHGGTNFMNIFNAENKQTQQQDLSSAVEFFKNDSSVTDALASNNPAIVVVGGLVSMAKAGLYDAPLHNGLPSDNRTYVLRFIADTGVPNDQAQKLDMTTEQYGMVHDEAGLVPGAWWLTPLGVLDNTVLANDPNGDRDGGEILGILVLLFIMVPFIPYVNRIPEKLHLERFFWRDKNVLNLKNEQKPTNSN